MRPLLLGLMVSLLLAGCAVRSRLPPQAAAKYTVGAAYQAGGAWYYPREDFRYEATGLAERAPEHMRLTADGEVFDSAAMAAAHQTLQLPAIARVTNLDTGLQVVVRINDRGPASPARLLGLTRRAADRLGLPPGGVARVRVQVEDGPSQALRDRLQGPTPGLAAAPRGAVAAEALAPPSGVGQSSRGRVARAAFTPAPEVAAETVPLAALPDDVLRVPADPGQLWLRAGQFGRAAYANQIRAKLYGLSPAVEQVRTGRSQTFRVQAGPFPSVAAADAALDRAMAAGVTDARIVVE